MRISQKGVTLLQIGLDTPKKRKGLFRGPSYSRLKIFANPALCFDDAIRANLSDLSTDGALASCRLEDVRCTDECIELTRWVQIARLALRSLALRSGHVRNVELFKHFSHGSLYRLPTSMERAWTTVIAGAGTEDALL